MSKGTLYLIPTVIADRQTNTIPDQVKELLKTLQYFLVENVRTSRRYISSLSLGLTIEDLNFEVLNKNTKNTDLDILMEPLTKGYNMGILSESGCPGVADPGAHAVAWAQRNGYKVIPLVGPSSILLALMGSGFNGQKFCFHGYLPIDKKKLEAEIRRLEIESRNSYQTQIFIETPFRNNQLLKTLTQVNNNETLLCIAKNLTAPDQLIETKTIAEWKKTKIDLHKIPTVFLMYVAQ
ncbi:MAG TPA: SAM-dependent methyltransferase [Fulvivirga sp.]|nr:SAM-dependent methyltransferase [Fulvivirga sp.]